MTEIAIDIGYGATKVAFGDKITKFPSSICYATDVGLSYGEDNIYELEGEKYYVGSEAVSSETFATTDYSFLYKFGPLLVYHVLSKFDLHNLEQPIVLKTGLAIVDWNKKDEFAERLSDITINGNHIKLDVQLIPQGAGCATDWVNSNGEEYPDKLCVLDIGYNTINLISFANGRPVRKDMKSYPGHGVSSIIKPFTSFMENKFSITFSEQESIGVFVKGEFKYNGELQEEVSDKITELKSQFVKKMFQSVLVNDRKLLAMADVVLIAGGGSYLLKDIPFPPNVTFVESPYEFSNVRGFL